MNREIKITLNTSAPGDLARTPIGSAACYFDGERVPVDISIDGGRYLVFRLRGDIHADTDRRTVVDVGAIFGAVADQVWAREIAEDRN